MTQASTEDVVMVALKRQSFAVTRFNPQFAAAQQAIADTFARLQLIPKKISIADALP